MSARDYVHDGVMLLRGYVHDGVMSVRDYIRDGVMSVRGYIHEGYVHRLCKSIIQPFGLSASNSH